jgi:hypothetical protein
MMEKENSKKPKFSEWMAYNLRSGLFHKVIEIRMDL